MGPRFTSQGTVGKASRGEIVCKEPTGESQWGGALGNSEEPKQMAPAERQE